MKYSPPAQEQCTLGATPEWQFCQCFTDYALFAGGQFVNFFDTWRWSGPRSWVVGGPGAWREFATNSIKHAATPRSSCYFDSLLLAYALLWREDDLAGAGLAALSALTGVISTLTAWNDVCYTAMHGRRGLRRHRDRV